MYTDSLRKKLNQYMEENACTLYRIEKMTGIHRQSVKNFLKGKGTSYETGMKIKKFIQDEIKFANEQEFKPKPTDNTYNTIE